MTPQNIREEIKSEIDNLPKHFHQTYSSDFLRLIAALRLHGFAIFRADEASLLTAKTDLWAELGHPSIWFRSYAAIEAKRELRNVKPGTKEHQQYINDILRANVIEQQRMLELLEAFYKNRTTSFYARLIVESIDVGEGHLRSQGSYIRALLSKDEQELWLQESQREFQAFTNFLIATLSA